MSLSAFLFAQENKELYLSDLWDSLYELSETGAWDDSALQTKWKQFQQNYEVYWSKHCPYIFKFTSPIARPADPSDPYDENAEYVFELNLQASYTADYLKLYNEASAAYAQAYKFEWTDLEKLWPELTHLKSGSPDALYINEWNYLVPSFTFQGDFYRIYFSVETAAGQLLYDDLMIDTMEPCVIKNVPVEAYNDFLSAKIRILPRKVVILIRENPFSTFEEVELPIDKITITYFDAELQNGYYLDNGVSADSTPEALLGNQTDFVDEISD